MSETIGHTISINEKIETIYNKNLWVDSPLGNYEESGIDFSKSLLTLNGSMLELKELSQTWDLSLLDLYAKIKSKEAINNTVVIPFGTFQVNSETVNGIETLFTDELYANNFIEEYIKCLHKYNLLAVGVFYCENDEISPKVKSLISNNDFDAIITDNNNVVATELLRIAKDRTLVFKTIVDIDNNTNYHLFNSLTVRFSTSESLLSNIEDNENAATETFKDIEMFVKSRFSENDVEITEDLIESFTNLKTEALEISNDNLSYRNLKVVNLKCSFEVINNEPVSKNVLVKAYTKKTGSQTKVLVGYTKVVIAGFDIASVEINLVENITENMLLEITNSNNKTVLTNKNKEVAKKKVILKPKFKIKGNLLRLLITLLVLVVLNGVFLFTMAFQMYFDQNIITLVVLALLNIVAIRVVFALTKNQRKKKTKVEKDLVSEAINKLEVILPTESTNYLDLNGQVIEEVNKNVDNSVISQHNFINGNYQESIDFVKFYNDSKKYFLENGFKLNDRIIRMLFSNFASSKLVSFNYEEIDAASEIVEVFASYIGANLMSTTLNPALTEKDLLNSNNNILTNIINSALENKDKIHIALLNDYNTLDFANNFPTVSKYVNNPLVKYGIKTNGSEVIIPKNVWFFVTNKNNDYTNNSINLNLILERVNKEEVITENETKLSFPMFEEIMRDYRETHFMDESTWKKIDELNEYLRYSNLNIIDNRIAQQIENYSIIYLLTEGLKEELVDDLLTSKILPIVNNETVYKLTEDDNGFASLVEKLFGFDNLTNSQVLLNKINENLKIRG